MLNEYGVPVATRQTKFTQKHYIEWQIGYDVVIGGGKETTLMAQTFIKAKSYKIITLENLLVNLKYEFNSNNLVLYKNVLLEEILT